jgi:hypothetical protein
MILYKLPPPPPPPRPPSFNLSLDGPRRLTSYTVVEGVAGPSRLG